jgi:hypothetical protein
MVKALIAGGGIAGPVTAMALQQRRHRRRGLRGPPPRTGDAGSYLTVATNGLDALRAVGADKPVLAAGFPTPANVLLSGTGRRLGTVSNGGRLADGTGQPHHQAGPAVPGPARGGGRPRHPDRVRQAAGRGRGPAGGGVVASLRRRHPGQRRPAGRRRRGPLGDPAAARPGRPRPPLRRPGQLRRLHPRSAGSPSPGPGT